MRNKIRTSCLGLFLTLLTYYWAIPSIVEVNPSSFVLFVAKVAKVMIILVTVMSLTAIWVPRKKSPLTPQS